MEGHTSNEEISKVESNVKTGVIIGAVPDA